jgi:DNA-binding IclR family transcriptional regulator
MACVNPDGSVTASAKMMLEMLKAPLTAEEASAKSGQPLFKVRSSLREMVEGGLVEQIGEQYRTTESGLAKT